jgi:hypothetical protein
MKMSKFEIDVEAFDDQANLLHEFVIGDNEDFSMALTEYGNMAYIQGWAKAIDMVLDVCGQMYNGFDQETLQELEQRIV